MNPSEPSQKPTRPRKTSFLDLAEGKRTKDGGRDGIIYGPDAHILGLYDPWCHPYRVLLDAEPKDPPSADPFATPSA